MSADSGTTITEEAEPTSTIPSEGADAISADALNIAIAVDSLTCTDKVGKCKEQCISLGACTGQGVSGG